MGQARMVQGLVLEAELEKPSGFLPGPLQLLLLTSEMSQTGS